MSGNPAHDVVITLDGVRKEFGDFVAVQDADFTIRRGEFFSLLGPSGCGKTTILKMIAGFEQPTAGRVMLEGADVSGVPPHKRNVNTVFQQYALFPHLSVVDNVEFGLRAKKVSGTEARKRAMEMLDIVRLAEFAQRRPAQLSGGQQQRVALARALVNMPSALLLDEPLAALDLKLREAMQIELKRIQREVGITFIFVTHDQGEALTMSDRIAVMSRGHVEQIGTPEEIYTSPSSIFVAGFIGSANLLPGVLDRSAATPAVVLDSGRRIDVERADGFVDGEKCTVMVRPERLNPSQGAAGDGRSIDGEVQVAIFQGSTVRLVVKSSDGLELISSVEADDDLPALDAGTPITLRWHPDATYLLKGRSVVVGATTTDVDEVEAALDGVDMSVDGDEAEHHHVGTLGRRALLVGGSLLGAAAVVGGVLSFTGSGKKGTAGGSGTGDTIPGGGTLGTGSTDVRILNWQAYIDPTDGATVGTVDRFLKDTGVKATYSEDFNDNNEVYAREIEPYLGHDQKANFDIICPTYWMGARLRKLGWIEPLPLDLIPNRVNLEDRFVTDAWNFGGTYSLPWQSGMTGIAFNPKLTGRDLTSFDDLLDPAFKGKVALLTEMRDSLGLAMLSMGKDPSVLDEDAMNAALDKIEKATKDGQFRAFTGNEYLRSLESGDFVACVAWSGDMQQLGYTRPDIKFVLPDAGGMAWYDTMIIPKGAPNGVAAAKWMNYVYDPVNAAQITAYVQYASPVKGVKEELIKMGGDAAKLAESPLIFPDAEMQKRLHIFAAMPDDVDARISARFLKITNG